MSLRGALRLRCAELILPTLVPQAQVSVVEGGSQGLSTEASQTSSDDRDERLSNHGKTSVSLIE